jgi:hypothetical protein
MSQRPQPATQGPRVTVTYWRSAQLSRAVGQSSQQSSWFLPKQHCRKQARLLAFADNQPLVLFQSKQAQQPRASLSPMQPHTQLVCDSRCGAIAALRRHGHCFKSEETACNKTNADTCPHPHSLWPLQHDELVNRAGGTRLREQQREKTAGNKRVSGSQAMHHASRCDMHVLGARR